jgi:hypothetical protein
MPERPFFANINQKNIDEIIIFDGNKLKYHVKRYTEYPHPEGPPAPGDIWAREEWHYYILFELNNDGNKIRQAVYPFNGGAGSKHERVYLQYDARRNWIYSREKADGETAYAADYEREIKYKN